MPRLPRNRCYFEFLIYYSYDLISLKLFGSLQKKSWDYGVVRLVLNVKTLIVQRPQHLKCMFVPVPLVLLPLEWEWSALPGIRLCAWSSFSPIHPTDCAVRATMHSREAIFAYFFLIMISVRIRHSFSYAFAIFKIHLRRTGKSILILTVNTNLATHRSTFSCYRRFI